jgi:uncharacterized membrane protein
VASARSGYVQSVDHPRLLRLASEHSVRLRVLRRPGHFVIEKAPLVEVAEAPGAAGEGLEESLTSSIQGAFILGGWRTADQDPEYGVHQLVEIAVRALSPGINDPFTAMTCVDRLAGVLGEIADRPARSPVLADDAGGVRVYLDPVDFPGVLDAAFDQIRQCATAMPAVSIRLLEALTRIAGVTADPGRRDALRAQARLIVDGCGNGWVSRDREALDERYRTFESQLTG